MKWIGRAFSWKRIHTGYTLKIITLFALCLATGQLLLPSANAQTRVYDLPNGGLLGTYYEVNVITNSHGGHASAAPLPMFYPRDPYTTPVYLVDEALGIYIFCGPSGTWSQLQTVYDDIIDELSSISTSSGPTPDTPIPFGYSPDDFYLEITSVDTTNDVVNLLLHATVFNEQYQLEFKTNIDQPEWALSQIVSGSTGTNNATAFGPEAINGNTHLFFRAHHCDVRVSVEAVQDAIETNSFFGEAGQPGIFGFSALGLTNDLVVAYRISGVASNGFDYTNISGTLTIPASTGSNNIFIQPLGHQDPEFDETVTLTLVRTNTYLIKSDKASATILIHDNFVTNIFEIAAFGLFPATGIDYCPPTDSLVVAINGIGGENNFWLINTNGISPWSTVTQFVSEVKFATVKQTAAGFTNGEIYFSGSLFSGMVGRALSNGLSSVTNWTTLPMAATAQGGFYVDQSGTFGNDLIAVTGSQDSDGAGVWRIKANGDATNVVFFPNQHFEGVITLTNDLARWGPWAGKIITGSETGVFPNRNLIRAIDAYGVVTSFDLGIRSLGKRIDNGGHDDGLSCEHFDVIPPGQDLYFIDEDEELILKLSHTWFSNYVGDLLITQGGLHVGEPEFYIVHWSGSDFVSRGIPLEFYSRNSFPSVGEIEGAVFAPVELP